MCWIAIRDQKPSEGDVIDLWVEREGRGFRVPELKVVGGGYQLWDAVRKVCKHRLCLRPGTVETHWKPAPPAPERH